MVYKHYLAETKNKKKAILEFKGVDKNEKVKKVVDKILIIEEKIKWNTQLLQVNIYLK